MGVIRRVLVIRRAMVINRAMVFRWVMVLLMGVSTRVMALNMVATTRDLLKLKRNLFTTMASADMGITNLGAMALDINVEVSTRRSFTITTNEMLRIPALTWSVER